VKSTHGEVRTISPNTAHYWLGFILLVLLIVGYSAVPSAKENATSTAEMDQVYQSLESDYITIELEIMPEKYQFESGFTCDYFTASPDSNFWCGPNRPHPFSWLSVSVVCRSRTDFQIQFCSSEGDSIDEIDFVGVEPATYRVEVSEDNRPEPGLYLLRFLYDDAVVDEFKVHIQNPR